jgi:hypothetical protein
MKHHVGIERDMSVAIFFQIWNSQNPVVCLDDVDQPENTIQYSISRRYQTAACAICRISHQVFRWLVEGSVSVADSTDAERLRIEVQGTNTDELIFFGTILQRHHEDMRAAYQWLVEYRHRNRSDRKLSWASRNKLADLGRDPVASLLVNHRQIF